MSTPVRWPPMQAVILAAGDGDRLAPHTGALPKPLVPLGGRPILAHVLDGLAVAGVREAVVVVGYRGGQVRAALAARPPGGVTLRFVENERYELGNARSLWAARDAVTGPFVLAMADHVVEPAITRWLVDRADGRCRLAVDRAGPGDARAAEATRARLRDGRVIDLGKSLRSWDALDTGMFWCTPEIFGAIDGPARDGELGDVFGTIARAGGLDAVDVTGRRWIDIDTPDDLLRAESMLGADGRLA
ncbi:MAG: phosphocholine cytidylyltransferase family protein [Chloroflexota bacterium]|nr:phosphocholine cytidylyltransferase family protein [Chloroflexota bacterium]